MISLIQDFEADFLWKDSLKILNPGIILKTFTHVSKSTFFDNLQSSDNKISQNKTYRMDTSGHQLCQICAQWIGSIRVNKDRRVNTE